MLLCCENRNNIIILDHLALAVGGDISHTIKNKNK